MPVAETSLRFYFITDDGPATIPAREQVAVALAAGATIVQYRNKRFTLDHYAEAHDVRQMCRAAGIPLIVNDHILLAKAIEADGVHVGQEDDSTMLARQILGPHAIVGISVSTMAELNASRLDDCDYIGCGPVFPTGTKADAKPEGGVELLGAVVSAAPIPVVAIGGIDATNTRRCFEHGAAGVAVISIITRAPDPAAAARDLAGACTHSS